MFKIIVTGPESSGKTTLTKALSNHFKILYDDAVKKEAIQWSLQRGNRTGRTAWQFILNITSKSDLKIKI